MKELKVLQLASGDLWAGAEVQFYNLCRKLHAFQGVQLRAILLNNGILAEELSRAGIHVTVLDEQTLSPFGILRRLARIVFEFQPDIIHSHRLKENVFAGAASPLSPRAKCVVTVHGAPETASKPANIYRTGGKIAEWLVIAFRFAAKIYVSHELRSRLEPRPNGKSRVIENGIDIEQTLEKARLHFEPYSGDEAKHIGFLGRLAPVKRPDLLLDVVEQAAVRDRLPYIFHVIGDGPLYNQLLFSAREKGVTQHIRIHGFHANPLPLLARMDCLLITSDHEGLPTNLLEAMCLGVPVVAHAVGEIPRVLEYGKLGILIENQDPGYYANALKECFSKSRPGRGPSDLFNRVKDRYSADRNAVRYLNLYQEILALKSTQECPEF